ncbi:MAG: Zn-dependent oligopeptidase [bacterium]|nr:Zn-dependent oligopeptidase [bacterium]
MTPDRFRAGMHAGLAAARQMLERFLALSSDASVQDVARAYDAIRRPLDEYGERVGTFTSLHPDPAIRETCEALEVEVEAFETELSMNRAVYDRLAEAESGVAPEPEKRFLDHALRDFRRAGVDRDEATRERVRALREELVEIGQTFDRNIVQGGRTVRLARGHAALAGLPPDYLAAHPQDADGAVTLTTDPPDVLPFMQYAEDDAARAELFAAFQNRAYPENLEVLDRLLAKRHELAQLLGYASWAEYDTETRMVKRPERAREFIERVLMLARPQAHAVCAELLEEKCKRHPEATFVEESEARHLRERVVRQRYGFDSLSVRPYFAYENVKRGIMETSSRLYGVMFEKNESIEVWHESVECWDILDSGRVVARFYLDMFPREGKFKHAAMFSLRHGIEGEVLPEAALGCNFARPTADDPALLLHDQVTTFFHEFGHLLHHLFAGRQDYMRFSGISDSTEWDFVEVPSQMYEEWAWDSGVLATFATHHETGEPIPDELVRTMRGADEYGKGLFVTRQMSMAMFSLSLYESDPSGLDTNAHWGELCRTLSPLVHREEHHFPAAFGHLHGYAAAYYTYMWSLVIAKDLFSAFQDDLMDSATAQAYRAAVLAPGGSRDAADLVEQFLGRPYSFDAWEAWLRS